MGFAKSILMALIVVGALGSLRMVINRQQPVVEMGPDDIFVEMACGETGTFFVELKNNGDVDVTVTACETGCKCATTAALPLIIRNRTNERIPFRVAASDAPADFALHLGFLLPHLDQAAVYESLGSARFSFPSDPGGPA